MTGFYHWKRKIRQTISLDAEMVDNFSQAAKNDNIDDAHDYADLWPMLAPNMPKRELFPCCAWQCNVSVAPQ